MKYGIIYADPPWAYRNYAYAETSNGERAVRGVRKEYETLGIEEIRKLPIESIAAENSVLFLWSTWPLLNECLCVFPAWGFEFKTCAFVWVKANRRDIIDQLPLFQIDDAPLDCFWGMGNWTRSNSECCLLGVRGDAKRVSAQVHQIIYSPIARHSEKPAETRDRIVKLCGDLPRVELFARTKPDGWDVWGNEVENDLALLPSEKL